MKRLLTYGLLLLTILASHFVVSACQDDLPETTEVMMTFTTRAVTQGAASTAPDNERMNNLHVIMLRSDGTIVGNHTEPKITASSVTFTFSTPIKTTGEDFTFLAIANENNIGKSLVDGNLEIGDELSTDAIKALTMNANLNAIDALPQTKLWTVEVPQTHNHKVNQTLDFTASKISVQFKNATDEAQSLGDIKITGIGSATSGYLFAQTSNDFGTQQEASDITFNNVTSLAAGATSDEQTYYTYPVSSVLSPTLHATWNNTEYTLPIKINDAFITALNRNDHLQIVITLTPAGDITVNYTIADWVDESTNIGDTAPTIPENGNGYQVDGWGASNDIEIGGGGGEIWDLGNGTTIEGEEVNTGWSQKINAGGNDILNLELPKDLTIDEYEGYYIYIEFRCQSDNGAMSKYENEEFEFDVWFMTEWYMNGIFSERNPNNQPFKWNKNHLSKNDDEEYVYKPYVRYAILDSTTITFIKNHSNGNYHQINTSNRNTSTREQLAIHILIETLTLIKPTN